MRVGSVSAPVPPEDGSDPVAPSVRPVLPRTFARWTRTPRGRSRPVAAAPGIWQYWHCQVLSGSTHEVKVRIPSTHGIRDDARDGGRKADSKQVGPWGRRVKNLCASCDLNDRHAFPESFPPQAVVLNPWSPKPPRLNLSAVDSAHFQWSTVLGFRCHDMAESNGSLETGLFCDSGGEPLFAAGHQVYLQPGFLVQKPPGHELIGKRTLKGE